MRRFNAEQLIASEAFGDQCPDLTPQMLAWLEDRFPLPEWHGGSPKEEAQYHYERGMHGLVQTLVGQRENAT